MYALPSHILEEAKETKNVVPLSMQLKLLLGNEFNQQIQALDGQKKAPCGELEEKVSTVPFRNICNLLGIVHNAFQTIYHQ